MASRLRSEYPAAEALRVIDGALAGELAIHRFDKPERTKVHLFAVGGPLGRQFAVILGDTNVASGEHPAKQTRLLLENCAPPPMPGIAPVLAGPYKGGRIRDQNDSKLAAPNQTSCLVADGASLERLLRWYAGQSRTASRVDSEKQAAEARLSDIRQAGIVAGFESFDEGYHEWLTFRASRFATAVGVLPRQDEEYDVGISDPQVGRRIAHELNVEPTLRPTPWAVVIQDIKDLPTLKWVLRRASQLATALAGRALTDFDLFAPQAPESTEALRLVAQRVGQDLFRRSLLDYWDRKCALSGLDVPELLRASHIKPWAECQSDAERLDVFNGLLLAPHLDALFDGGWLAFEDGGEMLVSQSLSASQRALLGLSPSGCISGLTDAHRTYLAWHREHRYRWVEEPGHARAISPTNMESAG